ncbi:LGFP repeat-containing protein [Bifidobacterium vansinderenii]|uniref:LGFP repeat-containing protein n=2 Tax=Bifidobacterium vansinderenii TaxID=1984871 RepID=A0A229VVS6_9BIFI|nr:LGFP repeat-containing protein [Bifidobacterium vansinderenii]
MTHENTVWKTALGVIAAGAMALAVAVPANAATTTSEQSDTATSTNQTSQSASQNAADEAAAAADDTTAAEFPGTPDATEAKDTTIDFASTDGLKDASGNPIAADATGTAKIEQAQGSFNAVKVDATAAGAKFAVRSANKDAQINAGTVFYIPVAYDAKGVSVKIAASQGNTAITVDGADHTTNEAVTVADTNKADFPKYVKVEFTAANYATAIVVDYASDSGYGTPDVQAKDKTYTFNASNASLLKDANGNAVDAANPTVQDAKGSFDDIKIDATSGKVYLRASDTQVNGGTTLYLPIAADAQGVSVTVQGNNNANLGLQLDGSDIAVGKAAAVPASADGSARYVPLSFTGTGSFYLTTISVDYGSDTPAATTRTVTVGKGANYQYQTIQDALNANDSSLTDRLTLKIAPGAYQEQVTVTKPGVVFRNADETAKQAVTIHEAYYAAMGDVTPDKDAKYDKAHAAGTNTSGTVLVKADGFSAYGITFQNDFNITTHPEEGSQTPAVAFYSSADKVNLVNCRMIGRQDTVWFNGNGRVNVENSYIEGTVDFVFGSADAYIHDTTLHMAHFAGKDNGYFTAPNTNKDHVGLVFDKCVFTVDAGNTKATLGRPWQTEVKQVTDANGTITGYDFTQQEAGKYPAGASSATTLLESKVSGVKATVTSGDQKVDTRWSTWSRKLNGKNVDVSYHPAVRFVEYNSTDENGTAAPTYDYTVTDNTQRKEFLVGKGVTLAASQLTSTRSDLLTKMGIGTGAGKWDPSSDNSTTPPEPQKTAVSVAAPAGVTTQAGTAPTLPAAAKVTWSDNSVTDEPVTWDAVPAESYAQAGTFTVAGKAAGLDVTVSVTVEAAPTPEKTAVSVAAPAGVTTREGVAPTLPAAAKVTWSDGSVTDENVSWDAVPAESYAKPGSFEVKGKAAGLDVTVKVTVEASQPDPEKPDPNTPHGAIGDYWRANGGASGWLGKPTGAELSVKGGASQTFQNGTVFWSSKTGAHGVRGGILGEYASLKWEQGRLGFPTSDENSLRGGASQVFQNGQIHWTSSTGAHATWGAIQGYWSDRGWENGWLGYPTGDELSVKGGVSQTFQNGTVFWSSKTGAYGVKGAILGKYGDLKWEQGKLGFPTSDERSLNGGASQSFQNGQIHWSPATGAHATFGAVQGYWSGTGWENGWLGYPTGDELAVKGGVSQTFQNGTVFWKRASGQTHGVRGGILSEYGNIGWEQGKLGFPISDENTGLKNGGASQVFENGQIHWSPSTGAHATLGAIQGYWESTGWENGWLGYPTSDEINDPVKKGEVYQNFQGGQIHWRSSNGSIYTTR